MGRRIPLLREVLEDRRERGDEPLAPIELRADVVAARAVAGDEPRELTERERASRAMSTVRPSTFASRSASGALRLVDEYESVFRSAHVRAKRPHTLGLLVEFIDNTKMVGEREPTLPFVEACVEYGTEGDVGFATLESDAHPELGAYDALRLAAWDMAKRGDEHDEAVDDVWRSHAIVDGEEPTTCFECDELHPSGISTTARSNSAVMHDVD